MRHFVLVSYDIVSDRRRRKVMQTLEGFGLRVQYSVFECWLAPRQIAVLEKRLRALIDTEEDSIRFYFLQRGDVRRIRVLGVGEVTPERAFYLR